MLFHSPTFFIFFVLFLPGFFFLKSSYRLLYTAVASFIFYAWWYPPYLFLLIAFTVFAFYTALIIVNCSNTAYKIILSACLLPLCFFKYTNFLLNNIFILLGKGRTDIGHWSLPLGISFITFTVLAYLVDIRRGKYVAERSFTRVALYLSFFPHLIAGPIMRPRELFPQFAHLRLKPKLIKLGLLLFSVGLIKKILFADILAPFVDSVYQGSLPSNFVRSTLAFYAFAVQIYCDFSGYVDMALGLAFILGIRLPLNFNRPYLADSIVDFWRRWHMTLSRWLRDYLYIPLGGSRHGAGRTFLALVITMLIGGLWHGAAWTFVLWGAYHGALLAFEHFAKTKGWGIEKLPLWVRRIVTFHLVCFGWIFFRAKGPEQMQRLLSGLLISDGWKGTLHASLFVVALIVVFFLLHAFDRVSLFCWLARRQRAVVIYGVFAVILLASMALSVGNPSAFIYFDF